MSKTIVHKWDSVGQFSRYLYTAQDAGVFKTSEKVAKKNGNKDWYGTASFEEADNLLRTGDRELFKRLQVREKQRGIKGSGIASKKQYFTDVCGFTPHVPNYVMGLPNNMINKKVVRYKSSKVVTVIYNPSAHCGIKTDEMIDASLNVINFVLGLERDGYKVNLYILHTAICGDESVLNLVRIKSSEDYTDKLKMVYPMVNPSMFRRHFLRCVEVSGVTNEKFPNGYGRPIMDKAETEKVLKQNKIKYDYVFTFNQQPNNNESK